MFCDASLGVGGGTGLLESACLVPAAALLRAAAVSVIALLHLLVL